MDELKVRGRFFAIEMDARTESALVVLRSFDGAAAPPSGGPSPDLDLTLPISREDRHHVDPKAVYEIVIRKVKR